MREYGYQAWHQYQLQMFEVTALQWDAAIYRKFSKIELLSMDGLHTVRTVTGAACDNYLLREYIGLKDKNGKDIYEEDIVGYGHGDSLGKYYKTYRVEIGQRDHDIDGAGFAYYGVQFVNIELDFDTDSGFYCVGLDHCEVIGNIYETPELLEVKQ